MSELQHLAALVQLQELRISDFNLEQVPAALSALTGLTLLDLYESGFEGGWDHLRQLSRLQSLFLHDSGATELPPALSCLIALTELWVDEMMQRGWEHLRALSLLCILDLGMPSAVSDPLHVSDLLHVMAALGNLHPAAFERVLQHESAEYLRYVAALLRTRNFPTQLSFPL